MNEPTPEQLNVILFAILTRVATRTELPTRGDQRLAHEFHTKYLLGDFDPSKWRLESYGTGKDGITLTLVAAPGAFGVPQIDWDNYNRRLHAPDPSYARAYGSKVQVLTSKGREFVVYARRHPYGTDNALEVSRSKDGTIVIVGNHSNFPIEELSHAVEKFLHLEDQRA